MQINKFNHEKFDKSQQTLSLDDVNDDDINAKYMKGETRLVTEQARYPLPTLIDLFKKSNAYILQPDFQRRKRWDNEKKSKLIESFIINVPIPPVFLYEVSFANYEVMDGLQRITTIIDFYEDKFALTGLVQWQELNGRRYSDLPEKIKEGIDRRYLSSIILLNESASDIKKAIEMKQLVFERLNTGGVKLSAQEIRNAIYNGKMNQLCIKLSQNEIFMKLWDIEIINENNPQQNKLYKDMSDVELVLRFFAMRFVDKYTGKLDAFLDEYLKISNTFPDETLEELENLFLRNIEILYKLFDIYAFKLYKTSYGKLSWSSDAQRTVYDPMMLAITKLKLTDSEIEKAEDKKLLNDIEKFYEKYEEDFDGKKQSKNDILKRAKLIYTFLCEHFNREVKND